MIEKYFKDGELPKRGKYRLWIIDHLMRECGYSERECFTMETEEFDFKMLLAIETKLSSKVRGVASQMFGV